MQEILNMFKKNNNDKKFDHIKISLASPDFDEILVFWRGKKT
jgi:hypothetical protein